MDGNAPQWPGTTSLCSGLLLAGGESRRMGSDKAGIVFQGEALWRRQLRTLRSVGAVEIMIGRGDRPPLHSERDDVLEISDAVAGSGPLGGLVAALRRMSAPWLMVLGIDLPLADAALFRSLLRSAVVSGRGAVPHDADRWQPLAAVYPKASLPLAEAALARGELSLQRFIDSCVSARIIAQHCFEPPDDARFFNVNTPEDLVEAEKRITAALHPWGA